jgi:hypothetical protein
VKITIVRKNNIANIYARESGQLKPQNYPTILTWWLPRYSTRLPEHELEIRSSAIARVGPITAANILSIRFSKIHRTINTTDTAQIGSMWLKNMALKAQSSRAAKPPDCICLLHVAAYTATTLRHHLWLPSHRGCAPVLLQPQKYAVVVSVATYFVGANPVPRCDPSQKGCDLLCPQEHQK